MRQRNNRHIVLQPAIQCGILHEERQVLIMAIKSANVTARVQPEIKQQAEAILANIGLPVSVLIDTLYRQIIMTGGVPYSLSVPQIPTRDSMTEAQFNAMM